MSLQDDDQIADLDVTEARDVVFATQVDVGDGPSAGAGAVDLFRRSTPVPHLTLPQENQVVGLDYTETGGVDFALQADADGGLSDNSESVSLACRSTSALHLTSFQNDSQIMDLDDSETGHVTFASQRDAEDENHAGSNIHPSLNPCPHLISPQDDDQITDLDDTETGNVVFASQADVWDDRAMDLVHRATPNPRLTEPRDNQVMDLDNTETGGVDFTSRAGAGGGLNADFETAGIAAYLSTSALHLTSPQHDSQIMDLDGVKTGSQRVAEDESDTDSETVSLSVLQPLPLVSFLSRMITRSRIWMVLRPWMLFSRREWMSGMAIPLAPGRWTLSVAQHLPLTSPFFRITRS